MLGQCLFQSVSDHGSWGGQPDLVHGLTEALAVLGHVDGAGRSADHFHAILFQHTVADQIQRAVQRGLAAHGRQHGVRALAGDDLADRSPVNRLDVHGVGHVLRVGHDGGGLELTRITR